MKLRNLALFAVVCALALPTFAASPVKSGKWQTTIEMEMPGMPMKMPPMTHTQCITKEQAEEATAGIPKGKNEAGCTFSDVKVDGSTISWKMTCEKQGMTGNGTVTYADDTYTGKMDMKVADREMHMKYSGKRLGDCDK
jgi:Protein of unknown function (DUF3617)